MTNSSRNFQEFIDWDKFDPEVKTKLDNYRDKIGHPVRITAGFEGQGHAPNSEHGQLDTQGLPAAQAADTVCKYATLKQQYAAAIAVGFINIGIYPNWVTPGIHMGVRKHPGETGRRWIGLGSGAAQRYLPWTEVNIKKYLV